MNGSGSTKDVADWTHKKSAILKKFNYNNKSKNTISICILHTYYQPQVLDDCGTKSSGMRSVH